MTISIISDIGSRLLVGIFLLQCCYFGYKFIYNIFFHPLSSFPGPKWAGASAFYEAYYDIFKKPGGQYFQKITQLHDQYGPIVRIRPNELHIRDLDFFELLYAHGVERNKDRHHVQIFGLPLSLFGTERYGLHRSRRVAINPFFSKSSVNSLDGMIQRHIRTMCDRISEHGKNQKEIQIRDATIAVTIDIVTEYSFGACAGALKNLDFSPKWARMMGGGNEVVPIAKVIPGMVQVMKWLPVAIVRYLDPPVGSFFDYQQIIRRQVAVILEEESTCELKDRATAQTSIFHSLLRSSLPPIERDEERLTQEGIGLVAAASETTSQVLSATIFHLLQTPTLIGRLRSELSAIMVDSQTYPSLKQLEKLPLLTAVVKEGLRITTAITSRLPLKAPTPLKFKRYDIPANTTVSMSCRDLLLDPQIYPRPNLFDPDRWLCTAEPSHQRLMEKAFLPFNRGSRMCLGFHLAFAELYHSIASMITRFDLAIEDTLLERDVQLTRDHFIGKPSRESKGVRVRVVKEYSKVA